MHRVAMQRAGSSVTGGQRSGAGRPEPQRPGRLGPLGNGASRPAGQQTDGRLHSGRPSRSSSCFAANDYWRMCWPDGTLLRAVTAASGQACKPVIGGGRGTAGGTKRLPLACAPDQQRRAAAGVRPAGPTGPDAECRRWAEGHQRADGRAGPARPGPARPGSGMVGNRAGIRAAGGPAGRDGPVRLRPASRPLVATTTDHFRNDLADHRPNRAHPTARPTAGSARRRPGYPLPRVHRSPPFLPAGTSPGSDGSQIRAVRPRAAVGLEAHAGRRQGRGTPRRPPRPRARRPAACPGAASGTQGKPGLEDPPPRPTPATPRPVPPHPPPIGRPRSDQTPPHRASPRVAAGALASLRAPSAAPRWA
jgi:hypothetical protein